ncbi:CheY-like chemotaxis protein [Methanolinea mesophila]|uniref:response regulator n=1 Tax=Methanolinea mesophila TaxID=547055 RepID=UPI001AE62019|nr:response regulator [Methanolinea mesophila]MBP1927501.1 CheY-like chemotaxis protein [Methanolinea mesophila]
MIKVLLVDDDQALFNVTRILLEKEGDMTVELCNSPSEALEMLRSGNFDAMVCDYQMPVMDGIEILTLIRKSGNTIPFILFTGKGNEEVAVKAFSAGANHYLPKAGPPQMVFATLRQMIHDEVRARRGGMQPNTFGTYHRIILEHISDAVWLTDQDLRVLYNSPSVSKVLGYDTECPGTSLRNLLTASGQSCLQSCLEDPCCTTRRSSGTCRSIVLEFVGSSGDIVPLEVRIDTIQGRGEPGKLLFVARPLWGAQPAKG